MKKKYFILLMILLAVAQTIGAEEYAKYIDDKWYNLNYGDRTARLTTVDYSGGRGHDYPGDVSIPPYVDYDGITFKVTTIEPAAFCYGGTTSLHIPETVVDLYPSSFVSMYDLRSVTVDEANPALITVDGVLFTRDMKIMYLFPTLLARGEDGKEMKFEEYMVPEGVEEIYAYFKATKLKRVILPNTLKKLGNNVLSCNTLTQVNLPESLEYLGRGCLSGTTIQSELHIPENVNYVGDYCFEDSDFTKINIPKNITCIEDGTFANTRHLETVELHEGITKVGAYAFEESHIQSLDLPDGLASLDYYVFCKSDIVQIKLGHGIERIGCAFPSCDNLRDIYSPRTTPPDVDSRYPLGIKGMDYHRKITVHVPEGCKLAYESTPWKRVGTIVQDLTNSVEEIGDENAILDNELCDAYTISGAHVASSLKYSDMQANLPKGLYIIRTASGKSAKIAVE